MTHPIRTIQSHVAFACPWYTVHHDAIILPDGRSGQYNVVDVPPCAFVVPVTAAGDIVLIRQYRYPIKQWVWEVPAGAIHPGETILQSAQSELREEIGGTSDKWQLLGQYQTANGRSNEVAHLYLATNVVLQHETAHEAAEILTVHSKPIAVVRDMIAQNKIQDGPSALAILLALSHLSHTTT